MTTKERNADKDFDTLAAAGNGNPQGIWSDGTTMWVANSGDSAGIGSKIYAYDLATKERDADKDFDTLILIGTFNWSPVGIWSDGTTMWVANRGDSFGIGSKIYAYDLATKERDADKDFDTLILIGAGNLNPLGIWSDGTLCGWRIRDTGI